MSGRPFAGEQNAVMPADFYGGRVDVVDCGTFPTGELGLDCEAF